MMASAAPRLDRKKSGTGGRLLGGGNGSGSGSGSGSGGGSVAGGGGSRRPSLPPVAVDADALADRAPALPSTPASRAASAYSSAAALPTAAEAAELARLRSELSALTERAARDARRIDDNAEKIAAAQASLDALAEAAAADEAAHAAELAKETVIRDALQASVTALTAEVRRRRGGQAGLQGELRRLAPALQRQRVLLAANFLPRRWMGDNDATVEEAFGPIAGAENEPAAPRLLSPLLPGSDGYFDTSLGTSESESTPPLGGKGRGLSPPRKVTPLTAAQRAALARSYIAVQTVAADSAPNAGPRQRSLLGAGAAQAPPSLTAVAGGDDPVLTRLLAQAPPLVAAGLCDHQRRFDAILRLQCGSWAAPCWPGAGLAMEAVVMPGGALERRSVG